MINAASSLFPETPVASSEVAPGKAVADSAKAFDSFLSDRATEVPANPLTAIVCDASTVSEEPTEDIVSDEEQQGDVEPDDEQNADALVLSSCLAAWQILPPPVQPQPTGVGFGGELATIESNSSSGESGPGRGAGEVSEVSAKVTAGLPKSIEDAPIPQAPREAGRPATKEFPEGKLKLTAEVAMDAPALPTARLDASQTEEANPATKPDEIRGSRRLAADLEVPHPTGDGIPVAKEQRAMSDLTFHTPAKPAPAAFAESETTPNAAHEISAPTIAGGQAQAKMGHDDSQAGMSGEQREQATPEAFNLSAGAAIHHEIESPKTEARVAASDTAQVIQQIERAIDRMHTQGGQRMEMRLPMRDGEEVVVKLRMEQGEVKATFQSGSETLRQALETGWSQLTQNSAERAGKAANAVFETPSMQSGMGGFQQSPDQRERSGSGRYSEAGFAPLLSQPEQKKVSDSRRAATGAAPATSLALYA